MVRTIRGSTRSRLPVDEETGSNVRTLTRREVSRSVLAKPASQESGLLLRPQLSIAARPGGLGVHVAGIPLKRTYPLS